MVTIRKKYILENPNNSFMIKDVNIDIVSEGEKSLSVVYGKIILEVSIQDSKLENLLKVIKGINKYNIELYEIDILTSSGNVYSLKVDGVDVEWYLKEK
jgi:hypothetical protein